jgi:type II secretion system protein G
MRFLSQTSRGFTLIELMIVIAVIGILAAVMFPAVTQYLARAHDTERYVGAKTINDAIRIYHVDNEVYPTFSTGLLSSDGFTHECSNENDGGFTWTQTIEPIVRQYTQRSPRDRIGRWPFCYMYKLNGYMGCPNSSGYSLIFATERTKWKIWDAYLWQWENGSASRHCFTAN